MHMTAPLNSYKHWDKPTNFHPLPVVPLKWLRRHICSACGDVIVSRFPSLSFVRQQNLTHTLLSQGSKHMEMRFD